MTSQGSHTKLYRDYVRIDTATVLFLCGAAVVFGAPWAVIAIIAAYFFGYETGQESAA